MKTLKFSSSLIPLVLNKTKNSTWRINDDKNIQKDDILSLCDMQKKEFAKAIVISTKITTFSNLTKDDLEGHEKFNSQKEMIETYSKYYNLDVTLETKLKIIKFKLL